MIERLTDEFEILNILQADNKKEQYPHEHYSYNKAADRQVKREEMANQLKIAKTNKNKYDKKQVLFFVGLFLF